MGRKAPGWQEQATTFRPFPDDRRLSDEGLAGSGMASEEVGSWLLAAALPGRPLRARLSRSLSVESPMLAGSAFMLRGGGAGRDLRPRNGCE